jgi:uncharacterized protein
MAIILYLGYLTIIFSTWIVNGVDYNRIGESAETTKLWHALPTLFGCDFLVVAIRVIMCVWIASASAVIVSQNKRI